MARPYWSGQIQISLVSFGVSLYPATSAASQVRLHQIDRKSGERIHHRNVTSSALAADESDDADGQEHGGGESERVEKADIIKGYEYRKGEYITLEPDELAKLRIPGKKTFAIGQFVERSELPLSLFEKPYFVVPQNETQVAAFAVVREALKQTGKAGLGEIAFSGREHLVALMAPAGDERGMMAYTLRYGAEMRSAAEYMSGIAESKVDDDQLSLAKELIKRSSSAFDPKKYKDDYETALKELLEAKAEHRPLVDEDERRAKSPKMVNLMDALRRSLGAPASASKKPSASATTPKQPAQTKRGIRLMKSSASPRRKSA